MRKQKIYESLALIAGIVINVNLLTILLWYILDVFEITDYHYIDIHKLCLFILAATYSPSSDAFYDKMKERLLFYGATLVYMASLHALG